MIVKKSVLCASVYLFSSLLTSRPAIATEPVCIESPMSSSSFDDYAKNIYSRIDFGKGEKLSEGLFKKALQGYLNLRNAGKLNTDKQVLTIADFTKSSTADRLWVIDLKGAKVMFHTMVAHGSGSGEDFATQFSNNNESHQSSLGFYVTADCYNGEHGNSLRLNGMDNGFNSAALNRGIVVHAAEYVSKDFAQSQQRIGRSWGCPAINPKLAQPIINVIKGGTCLFVYYPQRQYLASSYWLNKKVENVPYSAPMYRPVDTKLAEATKPARRDTVVYYMNADGTLTKRI